MRTRSEPESAASDVEVSFTLTDALRCQVAQRPDAVAIEFGGASTSYAGLDHATNRLARALLAAGVKMGDRVCILSKNCDRFFECLFAVTKIGAVLTPISWRLASPEIEYIVENSGARVLFTEPEFVERLAQLGAHNIRLRVLLSGSVDGFEMYEHWRDSYSADRLPIKCRTTDVAVQAYTSGTTGRPKGAMITNGNLAKFAGLDNEELPLWRRSGPADVNLVAMPTFHIGGMEAALRSIVNGGRLILHREFSPEEVIQAIERHCVTVIGLVPSALQMLIEHPDVAKSDLRSLRVVYYGASPIPMRLLKTAIAILKCQFVQCYGMTEATGTEVMLAAEDHAADAPRMLSAGRPLPGVEARVVNPDGSVCATNEVGEIQFRSKSIMAGYWRMPEATANAIDLEGWFKTGDAGSIDVDGYIYVSDRVKDMIISGGENIYPAEVESVLFSHPGVREVAVIGVDDAKWGESVKAIVVLRPDAVASAEELISWLRGKIASFKVPRSVEFMTALPRNASGKVLKTELRKRYASSTH